MILFQEEIFLPSHWVPALFGKSSEAKDIADNWILLCLHDLMYTDRPLSFAYDILSLYTSQPLL